MTNYCSRDCLFSPVVSGGLLEKSLFACPSQPAGLITKRDFIPGSEEEEEFFDVPSGPDRLDDDFGTVNFGLWVGHWRIVGERMIGNDRACPEKPGELSLRGKPAPSLLRDAAIQPDRFLPRDYVTT